MARQGMALLALCTVTVSACLVLVQPVEASNSEEFAFRIAARLHPNGAQLEFGIQRIYDQGRLGELHLEYQRFVDLDTDHHRWLFGEASYLWQAATHDAHDVRHTKVRVVARLHPTRGQFQFGAQYELDDTQLPDSNDDAYASTVFDAKQFFPDDVNHHRWLYSGEIRFTRVWTGDDTMGAESTMEDDNTLPEVASEPATPTAGSCLAEVEADIEAMLHDACDELLDEYCETHPAHAWCQRRRPDN